MFLKFKFYKYVSNFNMKEEAIHSKYFHSFRVMKLQEKYAKALGFNKKDIKLAKIIGLLHDIGRFEQYKVYKTYDDQMSTDHALLGVKILFEDNLIKKFVKDEKDYELIKFAILNHNKYQIDKLSDERFIKHAKLIRDTDKIDIFYVIGYLKDYDHKFDNSKVNPKIVKNILNHEIANYKEIRTNNDFLLLKFAAAFDLNYDLAAKELRENFKHFYEKIAKDDTFEKLYDEVVSYLIERERKC
ncbi:MAG: HD domain-containing protein [Mollicutes bacterium]|nr:HD domain-containing protein [Mollicutes bacterium]